MISSLPASEAASDSVIDALRARTRRLHTEAERSGILNDLLRGTAPRSGFVLLLRNLAPVYQALEEGLARHAGSALLGPLVACDLARAPAIAADLTALAGNDWAETVPLLAEGDAYAGRIEAAAAGDGARLIAHAYTRYLGDLSGGQILRRLLGDSLGLGPDALRFYDFSALADADAVKRDYRALLDAAGRQAIDRGALIEEGAIAFAHNIDLSCAVQTAIATAAGQAQPARLD